VIHPSTSVFELYVIGALPGDDAAWLEAHVADCPSCSERLAREALLEVKLNEAAARLGSLPAEHQPRWLVWLGGAALATAVSVVVLTHRSSPRVLDRHPAAVDRPSLDDQLAVRHDAISLDGLDESMAGRDLDSRPRHKDAWLPEALQ